MYMSGGQKGVGPRWTLGGWIPIKYILCPTPTCPPGPTPTCPPGPTPTCPPGPTPTCPPDFIHMGVVQALHLPLFHCRMLLSSCGYLFSLTIGMSVKPICSSPHLPSPNPSAGDLQPCGEAVFSGDRACPAAGLSGASH